MSVSEKVAYLRGLMEGLDIADDSKEGKLFAALVDALDEVASEISDLEEDIEDVEDDLDELEAYIEEVDEALGDVEDDCIEVVCPACGAEICIDIEDIDDDGKVECPACAEILEFDIEEEIEDEE